WFIEPFAYAHLEAVFYQPGVVPEGANVQPAFTNFTDPFFLKLKLSLVIGLIISAPLIVLQIWAFVRPGLRKNERQALRIVAPISAILFVLGACFAYLIIKPALTWFLGFLSDFEGAGLIQSPGNFVFFVLKLILAGGIGFQLPIILWFLSKIGLLTSSALFTNWRMAILGVVIFAALLTPGGDFFSLAALSLPLMLLYFAGAAAALYTERKRKKKENEYEFD
ncbi:MAG: twin-arginine translocase subunit TatC, partial [Candidatus Nitrosotenuis sp.]